MISQIKCLLSSQQYVLVQCEISLMLYMEKAGVPVYSALIRLHLGYSALLWASPLQTDTGMLSGALEGAQVSKENGRRKWQWYAWKTED